MKFISRVIHLREPIFHFHLIFHISFTVRFFTLCVHPSWQNDWQPPSSALQSDIGRKSLWPCTFIFMFSFLLFPPLLPHSFACSFRYLKRCVQVDFSGSVQLYKGATYSRNTQKSRGNKLEKKCTDEYFKHILQNSRNNSHTKRIIANLM